MKIDEIWERRVKDEPPDDVVFGRFHGTRLSELLMKKEAKEQVKEAREKIAKGLSLAGKRVIDVGVGPLARFLSVFSEWNTDLVAIDLSRGALGSAKNIVNGKGVNLILADIMNLPFKKETADLSFFGLWGPIMFLPAPIRIGIFKIWLPISERLCKKAKKNIFLKFMGVGRYLKVEKYSDDDN